MTPVPVPVVNEYEGVQSDVEKIARQLHAQHQDEPVWDKLDGHKRDDYHLFAARVLQCPSVAAAFEAQAKLEAAAEAGSLERLLGQRDALAARLAEVEAENARLRELALVEAEGQHDEMLGATGLAAERDRLAQELEDAVKMVRAAHGVLSPIMPSRDLQCELVPRLSEFLARFPREGDS